MRFTMACAAAALTGCTVVTVVPSGSGVSAAAKPCGCAMPVLRFPPRDRAYDELASLHYTTRVNSGGDPAAAQSEFQARACELGADALLVTGEFTPGTGSGQAGMGLPPSMSAVAIRFRPSAVSSASVPAAP